MAEAQSDWSTNSNDAIYISLVVSSPGGPTPLHTFHPKMTYPIFGDEESIFGYQKLKINLRYNACDMRPGLQIKYDKKFKPQGETSATDLKAILEEVLPKTSFEKTSVFDAAISSTPSDWEPPGELLKTIEDRGETYEIWKGSLADLAVQQMINRIQILVPFFIEGGTPIQLRDPEWTLERWTVFFLYNKRKPETVEEGSPYVFMGYSTVYRYFFYQPIGPSQSPQSKKEAIKYPANSDFELPLSVSVSHLPCRSRISQFIILPPFQNGGNGSRLYNTIFDFYLNNTKTVEITVEDPNEAFDDMRDINDLRFLRKLPEFASLRINTNATAKSKGPVANDILPLTTLESIRTKTKIAPRQFARVVEMQLLSFIPKSIRQSLLHEGPKSKVPDLKLREHEYHLWQLWVKKRLYRHNKDTLIQLDRTERIDKLEEALGGVEADYARLLGDVDRRDGKVGKKTKREEAEEVDDEPPAKKVKV
ncbi:hypothetical protein B7494_g4147 [Chlorociboria aeruginascens]|nr:hypothetical protein B7494_g4147 [Chlorociboria aeruginascens]